MKKKFSKLLLLVMTALLLTLTGCGGEGTRTEAKANGKSEQTIAKVEPIKVGAVYSLTGANSPLGVPEKQAVELLLKEINEHGGVNGRPLDIIFEDDKSDNTEAVKAIKKLVTSDKVVAVLGSSGSGPSLGMAEYAASQSVPLISMAAANQITDPVRKGIFKTPHTDIHGTKRIYKFLQEKNIKKVAVLYDSNPYGSGWDVQLKNFAPEYGIALVAEEKYGTKDPSMSSQLTKIKSTNADAIIVAGTNPGPAIIAKEAKQMGIKIPIINSHGSANNNFIKLAGDAANGVLMVTGKMLIPDQIEANDPQANIIKKFAEEYKATYNGLIDGFSASAYDGLNILVEGLKQAKGDPAKLSEVLENLQYVGVTGEYNFSPQDHNGLHEDSMIIVEVKDGKFEVVK
ncbi:ABC transporter substrate-binding protein [Paenibacillus tyrfis]|uniref:ABC transporter substrate-binding protein n=1 Tax=Paenibacillus tyrfis TaxID=1501230 RepID=UPI0020A0C2C7|nr:ABC transporter substrate-binding protein [Paenibacillus tyrfis]MCP1312395.1 ABC transporter substrate-binding protein [Paenibacillus tyrfis]